jgi:trimeric autotransporter adhesin
MKKLVAIYFIAFLIAGLFVPQQIKAQSPPQKMSFQAVIRDANNALIASTTIGMQISFLQGSSTGTVVYTETQTPTTNANGLVSLEIGTGTVITGTFSAIDWANGPFYIKTDTDPDGSLNGIIYTITGTSQLLSVPYALYAETSGSGGTGNYWELDGNSSTLDDGTFFIGTTDNIPFNIKVNNQKAGRIDNVLNNSFYGFLSGNVTTTGQNNSAFGMKALTSNLTGHMNTSVGTFSLFSNTLANGNVAIGESALYLNTTGGYNSAVGRAALLNNITGERNTAIGEGADVLFGSVLNYATAIGSRAYVEQSNSLILGSINGVNGATASIDVGIGTTKPDAKLHIKDGFIKIEDGTEGLGKVLTSDAVGLAHWEALPNATSNNWALLGNAGTSAGLNFIGTTDLQPLMFKVNSVESGFIDYDPNKANTFLGFQTGLNNTGLYNTAMGYVALSSNTTGDENTATGYSALSSNTIGSWNTATGFKSLVSNTIGIRNVANGRNSLFSNTTGQKNTATGDTSMQDNTTGNQNTANGTSSMAYNITGNYNTAMGVTSLYFNTTGSDNTAVGYASLYSTTASSGNTALGNNAGDNNINNGNYNTFIGYDAYADKAGYTNTTALGYGTITTSSNQIRLGNANVSSLYFGTANNLAVTTDSIPNMYYDYSTGQIMRSTASASNSANNWNLTGNAGTVDGTNFIGTTDNVPLSFKVNNIFAGRIDNMLGNVFFGSASGINNNTTASSNTAIGYFALNTNISGTSNTALGANALQLTTGDYNTAIGGGALSNNSTGSLNVAVGMQALMMTTTGTKNTALGTNAYMSGTLTNSTVIGYGAQTTVSNTIQLGDANVINVNTAGTVTAGAVTYLNTDGTSGQVLTTNGAGATSWASVAGSIGGFTHYLGEDFNGGIIYYLYKGSDGLEHGLIVSKTESTAVWQVTRTTTNADRTEDGTYNTGLMTGSAAATYIGTLGSGWYLPSIDELGLLNFNRYTAQKGLRAGGFTLLSTSAGYWSSTEDDLTQAFIFIFGFAGQSTNKNNSYTVRGVRSF